MRRAKITLKKLVLLISVFSIFSFVANPVYAANNDEDDLKQQLEDLQDELKRIQDEKKKLEEQITQEDSQQEYLRSQIEVYENSIRQTELIIEETRAQIDVYELEVNMIEDQIDITAQQIQETEEEIQEKIEAWEEISFNIYRNNQISDIDILLSGKSIDDAIMWNQYLDMTLEEGEKIILDLEDLRQVQENTKEELEAKKNESENIKSQLEAEQSALGSQINGLETQKDEREGLLVDSQNKEYQLEAEQKEVEEKAKQIEQEMAAIEMSLLSRVSSGSKVKAGDVIARNGRTGYVLTYGDNPRTEVESIGWYYPHPDEEPSRGVHLHFSLFYQGGRVNPLDYIGTTIEDPIPGHIITRGYGGSHLAVDFVYPGGGEANLGKPVYAPCNGTVSYHTSPFDADDYGFTGGPFPADPAHFFQLDCSGELSDFQAFGWHIQ